MTPEHLDQLGLYLLIGLLALCFLLETFFPLFRERKRRGWHILNNLGMLVVAMFSNFLLASGVVWAITWADQHQFGLLRWLPFPASMKQLPPVLDAFLGVALFDFLEYWAHRFRHRNGFFWRFHRVHHADTDLDASSAQRVHPGELLLTVPYQVAAAFLLGYSLLALSAYLLVFTGFTIIQHANIRLPYRLDKALSYVFSTPNVHKVHHSAYQPQTDSNYADIFSVWDRLFGTFHYPDDIESIQYGLHEYPREVSTSLWHQLTMPFRNHK
ncbi:sterol desaturase/sphingolipid hydroxylase (fatty acid hydroxylase superfamily) [Larkinella arboricola]|uniref:Sterol desaturase/sphingolipid hydroxylase (Fatty acid hydroxylase superfamily) n=1 Tax=Larkinella arboricola TaxID=643671 RepID=A0A327WHR1_LARAB|nr:sterol desaturase family protein [Larkinella arboricola]RAJ91092.1 sterol desaturase/sphingolipid hydroxylase (fatty acid hydroxylase superfamily) [Larkinella arboricola]